MINGAVRNAQRSREPEVTTPTIRPPARAPSDLRARFGANLRAARLKARLTQAQLAAATGIRQTDISEIEGGARNTTLETMGRLAAALGIDVRKLLAPPKAGDPGGKPGIG